MIYLRLILLTTLIVVVPWLSAAEPDTTSLPADRPEARFTLHDGDVVVVTGGTNAAMTQWNAYLETLLTTAYPDHFLRFRNMAWQADTVYRQQRPLNFGDWDQQLKRVQADVVFCWFGQMEAMDGPDNIPQFIADYEKLLDTFSMCADRAVLISPIRFEKSSAPLPNLTNHNPSLIQYAQAIRELAHRREAPFIDLISAQELATGQWTEQGLHLTDAGHRVVALCMAQQLNMEIQPWSNLEPMRQIILYKNELWHRYWRPMNWAFLAGDRTHVEFSRDAQHEIRTLPKEIESYLPLIEKMEQQIRIGDTTQPSSNQESDVTVPPTADEHDVSIELASFVPAEGYEINLFASEKDGIPNPIQMRWDPKGRLYVLSTPLYPHIQPDETPNDKVVVLEDTNGDGRADKSQVFADNLHIPEGIALGDDGVYLSHCTDLLHLTDTDGDGQADHRRVVLSGFGTGDTHQVVNNLTWGPSGALYFCQGLHIFSRIETPWGIERLDAAGVWRWRPRQLKLDPFFGNERIPHNPWGILFDDWGQPTLWSGNGHGTCWMTPAMVRHSFYENIPVVWTRQKTTTPEFLGGSHLGRDTADIIVAGDYKSNAVLRFQLSHGEDTTSLSLTELTPLLVSSHRAFRPTDIKMGPDGAIYVADWYNPMIGHYQTSYRHPERDKMHGRIWRITSTERPLLAKPQLTKMPTATLLDQLRSPERWIRDQAIRLLTDMPTETFISAMNRWVTGLDPNDPLYEQLIFRAIGLYESHEVIVPHLLPKLTGAHDPRARAYAARVVGHWGNRILSPLDILERLVNDLDPRVRLEAVVACSYVRNPHAIEVATMALDHPRNKYIDFALLQTVHELKEVWAPWVKVGGLQFGGNQEHLGYVLRTEGSREMMVVLENWSSLSSSPQALLAMAKVGDARQLAKVFDHPNSNEQVLTELKVAWRLRNVKPAGDLTHRLDDLLDQTDEGKRAAAIGLCGVWGLRKYVDTIQSIARNDDEALVSRIAAIEAFTALRGHDALETLIILATSAPPNLQPAIIAALSEINIAVAAHQTAIWIQKSTDEQKTIDLLTPLLIHQRGATALAEAFGQVQFDPSTARRCQQIFTAAGISDPSLLLVVNRALGLKNQPQQYDPQWVQNLAAEVNNQGDVQRGRTVYRSKILNCTSCHKIDGAGGNVGPDLSSVGRALPVTRIIEEVLWPTRQIKEGYIAIHVTTSDGKIYQGIKVFENPIELVLRDAISKQNRRIATSMIDERTDAGTLMPSALTFGLRRRDLRDLIRYLKELDGFGKSDPPQAN